MSVCRTQTVDRQQEPQWIASMQCNAGIRPRGGNAQFHQGNRDTSHQQAHRHPAGAATAAATARQAGGWILHLHTAAASAMLRQCGPVTVELGAPAEACRSAHPKVFLDGAFVGQFGGP